MSGAPFEALSDHAQEWQGLPIPIPGIPLRLQEGHPLKSFYDDNYVPDPDEVRVCDGDMRDESIVNSWFSRTRNCHVVVVDTGGRRGVVQIPESPDRSMDRLTMWITTLGASDAWDLEAEYRAKEKLIPMLTDRQWRHYELTGTFLESSTRSGISYMFRRLRPTIALSPRGRDGREGSMMCIATLCLHPIGFYDRTWAGCMAPTDDVIAHLTMMRGDEAHYWGQANKHAASAPEAGL